MMYDTFFGSALLAFNIFNLHPILVEDLHNAINGGSLVRLAYASSLYVGSLLTLYIFGKSLWYKFIE